MNKYIIIISLLVIFSLYTSFTNDNTYFIVSDTGCCSITVSKLNDKSKVTYYNNYNNTSDTTICDNLELSTAIDYYQEWCYKNHYHKK